MPKPQAAPFTYFISDLHLSEERDDITECFFHFLREDAPKAEALYILGDLFEVWIGDDNVTQFSTQIACALNKLSQLIPVYFIHGNRDFALGKQFAQSAGVNLLPEQKVIELYNEHIVILHGDEMCTRDVEYMKFRKKARGWWWPRLMKAIPLYYRKKIAEKGREVSKNKQKHLSADIMDVTQSEVEATLLKHNVYTMIHGHTHRPNIHYFTVSGHPAKRIVLGDWYEQGSVLKVSKSEKELLNLSFSRDFV